MHHDFGPCRDFSSYRITCTSTNATDTTGNEQWYAYRNINHTNITKTTATVTVTTTTTTTTASTTTATTTATPSERYHPGVFVITTRHDPGENHAATGA